MTTEDPKTEIEVPTSARRSQSRTLAGIKEDRRPYSRCAAVGTVLAGLTGYWTTYRTVTKEILAPAKPAPAEAAHLSSWCCPSPTSRAIRARTTLADGITDNLTTDLSRIRNSFVIARNTAFTYKGKSIDAKEIGKEARRSIRARRLGAAGPGPGARQRAADRCP